MNFNKLDIDQLEKEIREQSKRVKASIDNETVQYADKLLAKSCKTIEEVWEYDPMVRLAYPNHKPIKPS
jgi:hypothetical protein